MKKEVDALLKSLSESGCDGAQAEIPKVVAAMQAPVDDAQIRRALDGLRSERCFSHMEVIASQAVKLEPHSIYVRRQLAQVHIESGLLKEAIELLWELVTEVKIMESGSAKDRSEVMGLLGRAHKQRFVAAVTKGEKGDDDLRAAIGQYRQAFDLDPAWHGANIVALVARAERDGIEVDTQSSVAWAKRLLKSLQEKGKPSWSPWDYAAAGEAYLALGDKDEIADSFAHYWNMLNADPFALFGTERQLKEIWQIIRDSPDPSRSSLLVHLEARRLAAAGGGAHYSADDLVRFGAQLQTASAKAEATFGAGSALPLERVLGILDKAKSICKITDVYDSTRGGTGFLVNGHDVSAGLEGKAFVLTNHHVLHGDEASEALLEGEDYKGSIHVKQARAEFHYWDGGSQVRKVKLKSVVRSSVRTEGDFALATLAEELPLDRALALSETKKPLGSRNILDPKQKAKVFVVGHPKGETLSFSFSDNEVVDHELDDSPSVPHQPRRIHYRAPTERGSSGSPVFHHQTLEVVGLHRSGDVKPLRSDWPRSKGDELYTANEAVSIRSIRDYLA